MSINKVKAEYIIGFAVGILFIAFGIYGIYHFITIEMVTRQPTKIIFAGIFGLVIGLLLIRMTYPVFIPIKKSNYTQHKICPFCGCLVEEDANFCEKCKRNLND